MGTAGARMTFRRRWATTDRQQRQDTLIVATILGVAFVVRLLFVLATPHFRLANDPADYQRLAVSLATGHGWGKSLVAPAGGPTAFRPPLYPLFLAAIYAVFGIHIALARLLQAVLGVITVGLLGAVCAQLWGRRVALIGMAIGAFYPPFILAGGSLLSESLALPLELVSLLLLLRGRSSAHRVLMAALAGIAAGAGILDRPNSAVLLIPFVLLTLRWPEHGGGRRRTLPMLALLGAMALTVTPWMVRDAVVMHHYVPLTTQTGLTAAGTYNDTTAHDRSHPAAWRPPNFVPQYASLIKGDEYHEERALRTAAVHYAEHHPGYDAKVLMWNTLRVFDLTGPAVARSSWAANGFGPTAGDLTYLCFLLTAAIAVGGAFTRKTRRVPFEVWLMPVVLVLVTIPFLGESRLRLPIEPFIVMLAALAVAEIVDRFQSRRTGPSAVGAAR